GGGAEAREHAHGPEPPAIHRGLNTARERILPRQPQVPLVAHVDVGRREQVWHLDAAPGLEAGLAQRLAAHGRRHVLAPPGGDGLAQALELRTIRERYVS